TEAVVGCGGEVRPRAISSASAEQHSTPQAKRAFVSMGRKTAGLLFSSVRRLRAGRSGGRFRGQRRLFLVLVVILAGFGLGGRPRRLAGIAAGAWRLVLLRWVACRRLGD